jgi:uncharacterized SAM-binding protein YcdF (DUF218 family)
MSFASQLVTWLISPLGTVLVLCALASGLAWRGRRRLAGALAMLALAWLWVWGTPAIAGWLREGLEADFPAVAMSSLAAAPAAVVLGGAISTPSASRPFPALTDSSDRIWHAARLYRAGKAPLLVLSGGSDDDALIPEAEAMRLLLHELGVPDAALLIEPRSRTTEQNARFSAALLRERGIGHVLLVTSAFHMPRAAREFQAQGLRVTPVAVDHGEPLRWDRLAAWVPDAGALRSSAQSLKELVGRLALHLRRHRP